MGVCVQGEGVRFQGRELGRPPWPPDTWDTTGYGQRAGGTHPTGMHSCAFYLNGLKPELEV